MNIFPSIETLADAHEDRVLKVWEGLGYYSRAKNLRKAARLIMEEYNGILPGTAKELQKLPGIGSYTAAAIASMAFHEAIPLLDGNVLRVMTRLEQIAGDIRRKQTRNRIRDKLRQMLPVNHPGGFKQSLMDLGRTICVPKNPLCSRCPVSDLCQSYAKGNPETYPEKTARNPLPHYNIVIGLIKKDDEFLIQKRPAQGLLGGLWEFPGGKIEKGENPEEALLREIREETDLTVTVTENIAMVKQTYSHFRITLSAYFCEWITGEAQTHAATENRWIRKDQLKQYAFPKANLKILDLLEI